MDKIKIWAFPVLVSIVGWFIVNTLSQIRADLELVKQDVRTLLAQSNVDKTRIDNLEREVFGSQAQSTGNNKIPTDTRDNFFKDLYVSTYETKKQYYAKQTNGALY